MTTQTSSERAVNWNNSLVGTLDAWPLLDVLCWLHETGRTAMLRVGDGFKAGILFLRKGHLYRCELGNLQGEEALVHLLNLRTGTFSLIQRDPPDARANILRPTAELLLRYVIAQDENNKNVA